MSKQSSSDPLPYVQVDRAVKPRAAMLADTLGVTRQHAMGSLVEWWDLCGDPRELERIVEETPPDMEPAVILTSQDAALRFRLASTKDVEPVVLARIGLLEEQPDGRFRVRGMSRYFAPIKRRIQSRRAASEGGKVSAKTRKESTGSAQPVGGKGFEGGSVPASVPAQAASEATSEAEPKRNGSDNRSGTEATPKRNRTLAVSGQRSASSKETLAPAPPTQRESDLLCEDFRAVMGSAYLWQGAKDGVALAELRRIYPLEEIRSRWRRGLASPADAWASCRTVAQLKSKFNDLTATRTATTPTTKEPLCRDL
jgi:hypothetical protein